MRRAVLLGLTAATIVAESCSGGGGSQSPGSVTGTLAGTTMTVRSAISTSAGVFVGTSQTYIGNLGFVFLSDATNLCARLTVRDFPAGSQLLEVAVGDFTGSAVTVPTVTGPYTVYPTAQPGTPPPNLAIIGYDRVDATCQSVAARRGHAGTITLSALGNLAWNGSGNFTTTNGEAVTVSFNPTYCPGLASVLEFPGGGGTCQ